MRQGACRLTSGKATVPLSPLEGDGVPVATHTSKCDGSPVAFRRRQSPCRYDRAEGGFGCFLLISDLFDSELRSRLGWAVVWAIYNGLPDFQRRRLEGMGFGPFLWLEELAPDVALIQAVKERWDPECHTFRFLWGHMIPTLEDVVQITGLHVDVQAVTGVTYTSYQEQVERRLGLEVRGERSSLVQRTVLQASLGVANAHHRTGEGQADYMAHLTEDARAVLAEEEGDAADRDLRRFLILVIRKLILGTRGDPVGCRCLPLLEDLSSIGSYTWGAALLAHLFDSLGTSSRETGVAGFFPLLQVWAYYHLPSLGRGVARRRGAVPLLQRWRFCRDERSLRRQVTLIHDALDIIPFGHVQWTPYVGVNDAAQPWVERGRPYFGRDIWLHLFNTLILGTRGDPVGCRCLPLLEDLSSVGSYAWGAALLAHLFDSLGTFSRETGVTGFFPLLQRWRFCRDERSLRRQVTLIHDALDIIPFGHVQWTPYVGENDVAQPWVERGRPYFGRDIWLHSFNTVVPLHHRLVARTLGLHQAVVVTNWTIRVREQLEDWEQRGKEVVSEAANDEDYFRAYARRYGAQVYKGIRRPRAELDRAQQMVGGASSSREDPDCSVLEGQLASAVTRAEDAPAQLQERELELRNALARTTTLEAEMAELRLRPEAAEVTRWREVAEEVTRWHQEAEEATRLRTKAGDLRT
ncbi:hypothetical protein Taro_020353 [Colocasia esculenta]|uniref:Aminotransferase-like plant mobile domain-containing protein n=1 Tax=Colocasia esculenta TaxID=4460 RepID=A0A843UZC4_COLES|nr:hypothetical protein [Colocasia esculenta]